MGKCVESRGVRDCHVVFLLAALVAGGCAKRGGSYGGGQSQVNPQTNQVRNRAPIAQNATLNVAAGALHQGHLSGSDADGDALTFYPLQPPASGQLTVQPNGGFSFRAPSAAANLSFTFVATDGEEFSNVATVGIAVSAPPPSNQPPANNPPANHPPANQPNDTPANNSPPSQFEHVLFLSSQSYSANLGGLAGADQKCEQLADAAGLPGTFRAILSTSTTSARDRITIRGSVGDTKGRLLANNAGDFWDGSLAQLVSYDEKGRYVSVSIVWTGTEFNGVRDTGPYTTYCDNWTSTSGAKGCEVGRTDHRDAKWISIYGSGDQPAHACSNMSRIYCIEQ